MFSSLANSTNTSCLNLSSILQIVLSVAYIIILLQCPDNRSFRIEFDILLYLANNRGNVVSSEELFEKVWKEKYLDNNNTVMVHIRRIREKLKEDTRNPKYIKTVWGVGYKIE